MTARKRTKPRAKTVSSASKDWARGKSSGDSVSLIRWAENPQSIRADMARRGIL